MTDLVLTKSTLDPQKQFALQIREHNGNSPDEYTSLCLVRKTTADLIASAGRATDTIPKKPKKPILAVIKTDTESRFPYELQLVMPGFRDFPETLAHISECAATKILESKAPSYLT